MAAAHDESVPRFKVVLLGDTGVGKTALVDRVSKNIFRTNHVPTVGAQFVALDMIVDGDRCVLELWDTAGQEVFRSLAGFYTRDARGALLVFDVTNGATFEGLGQWSHFLKNNAPAAKVILFGNKCDLTDDRTVAAAHVDPFAQKHGFLYAEGSALTGRGVGDAFDKIAQIIFEKATKSPRPSVGLTIEKAPPKPNSNQACC
jgi:small GTP-binding protein